MCLSVLRLQATDLSLTAANDESGARIRFDCGYHMTKRLPHV